MERPDLMACILEPNVDLKGEEEPVEAAIWEAMDRLGWFSQISVIKKIGIFIRMEVIQTEKHQTRYQPLQPYMDEKLIGDYTRPQKQILMFFARIQREYKWKSPKYRFTRRQQEVQEALVKQVERKVKGIKDQIDKEERENNKTEGYRIEDKMEVDKIREDEIDKDKRGDKREMDKIGRGERVKQRNSGGLD